VSDAYGRRPTERALWAALDSEPELQPSIDTRWLALPWKLDGKRIYDRLGKPLLALLPAAPPEALAYALARCNASRRAEPVAQGVSRERVEALERWFRLRSEAAHTELTRESYRVAADKTKALLAASPDGEQGGGR